MVDVYSMIESYCNVISERCALLEKTRYESDKIFMKITIIKRSNLRFKTFWSYHLLTWHLYFSSFLPRECPEELREAVAGLIYGTSRCGDLQVLQDVRRIFVSKFGKDFVQAATELRNGCAIDPKVLFSLCFCFFF